MRVALVTGAAGGIGSALCRAFAEAGYRVVGSDRRAAEADYAAFVPADLARLCRDADYRAETLDALRAAIGPKGLHALINNGALQVVRPVEELDAEDWHATLDTNLVAPFLLVQGLLAELRRAGGSVVNVGSVHRALTKPGFACYATSKAALVGLTRSLAVELSGSLRVNCVNPAATRTPMLEAGLGDADALAALGRMHPAGRIASPDEVAQAVLYLASENASFVSGACLDVDGGIGARLHDPE